SAVPVRNDNGGHAPNRWVPRAKRFRTRNHRLLKPSRQGFSLISPRRDEYWIEISSNRIRESRMASILISSENAMLSDSSTMSRRIARLNTHMPDCESRTQRKNRIDVASDRTRLPNLCLKLMAWRSRTGNREALRKSASRCRNASSRYEIASGG